MTPVSQAFAEFDAAYTAMLHAAAGVRRAVAAEVGAPSENPCAPIIELVARYYGFTPEDLCSPRRPHDLAAARQAAMWLCRALTPLSLERIGFAFGGRDHGTVIHAIKSVGDRAATEPKFAGQLLDLRHRCAEALNVAGSASDPTARSVLSATAP